MKRILPVIVISQFFCTSLWFAGNAVIGDIAREFHLQSGFLAYLSSAVQLGFITGTLVFAVLGISDRFSPSRVFFACAMIGALINLGVVIAGISPAVLLLLRALTGFFLAGIYPVGMKIAADHYERGLGKSLGFLVGALVVGTAFPHLLKFAMVGLPWRYIVYATSALAMAGGTAMVLLVPDGPYCKPGQKIQPSLFLQSFKNRQFRAAAFGYFGHMWELYTFWVFVPIILSSYKAYFHLEAFNVPLLSFLIIVVGSLACVVSGLLSQRFGAKKVAAIALAISCLCCLASPLMLFNASQSAFLVFMLIWSASVIADSPLFSTLVAGNAPAESKGTALTIVNCIGFGITIISIQFLSAIHTSGNTRYIFTLLAIGPLLGLLALAAGQKSKLSC
ncbi:nitrate/nitrite transporter NarK [Mucilaginibacter yixingensis]|uniref:Nitrate/nitrite transporter NarK n=1 Tax=Mucilaginibacter yixingensis TaxID=1295612 RepID=A0A2T5J568_9SPHI|nr:MFS transporter [Mucilaginibacter yixingensis]PTQ92964.1 nitrate/nitrite transporter NarK [Mucilaginibacter yixingensis]